MRTMTFLAALGAIGYAAPGAVAAPGGVVIGGRTSARDQRVASDAATAVLRAGGWSIVEKALTAQDATALSACIAAEDGWACAQRIAQEKSLDRVAVLSLEAQQKNGATMLVLSERIVLATIDSVFVSQRFCDHCTDDTLAVLARELTQELLDRAAVHGGHTVLVVKSTPQGARFSVDGAYVGATDATINSVPGRHVVRIELDGFAMAERPVDAREGQTAEVSVTLHPLTTGAIHQAPVEPAPRARSVGPVPPALVTVGLLAMIGGGVAIALDGHDVTKPPTEDQPRGYYDTTIPGIAMLAGGALVAGLGGYLWWRRSSVAPTIAPTTGGGTVGLMGAF